MSKKLLLAFDDSENAMRAVKFLIDYLDHDCWVTLFSVVPDTAALCDMDSPALTPYFRSQQSAFCSLEDKKRELVDTAMQAAVKVLTDAGFHKDKVKVKIQPKNNGIARDIVTEARSGYDAIVIGRRGLSGIKELILGSTSHKVFELAKDISILVIN
ncbi:universal stress protein [Thermodesulfobacteriota bacterium]